MNDTMIVRLIDWMVSCWCLQHNVSAAGDETITSARDIDVILRVNSKLSDTKTTTNTTDTTAAAAAACSPAHSGD